MCVCYSMTTFGQAAISIYALPNIGIISQYVKYSKIVIFLKYFKILILLYKLNLAQAMQSSWHSRNFPK